MSIQRSLITVCAGLKLTGWLSLLSLGRQLHATLNRVYALTLQVLLPWLQYHGNYCAAE